MAQEILPYQPDVKAPSTLDLVLQGVELCERHHTRFVERVEKLYRAYRGFPEKRNDDDIPEWMSQLTIPYVQQTVESEIATLLMPDPTWEVTPRRTPTSPLEVELARRDATERVKIALNQEMDEDRFNLKQRPFIQQDLIVGFTVAKVIWENYTGTVHRLTPTLTLVSSAGEVIDSVDSYTEEKFKETVRDGPCFIVRDVRDFMWPASATDIQSAAFVIDRAWMTFEELKKKESDGVYDGVDKLKDEASGGEASDREQKLRGEERNSGLIEVLEYWTDDRVITVGARKQVLSDKDNPFWHGKKPFVLCSSMPDAFQLSGISAVGVQAQTQEYLWTVQNQKINNIRLHGNPITLIRSDVDDSDGFEFYPGAHWDVEDLEQVKYLEIDPSIFNVTTETEQMLMAELQRGGLPAVGDASPINTATGMSIVASTAERLIKARQAQYSWAYGQIAEMFLSMMGQFVRQERQYSKQGLDNKPETILLQPTDFQGAWSVGIRVMDDSQMRQEKRAEAQTLMQMAAQVGPAMNLNLQAFMEEVLRSYGFQDTSRFFSNNPAAPGGTGAQGEAQGAQGIIDQNARPSITQGPQSGQTNAALAGAHGLSQAPDQLAAMGIRSVQGLSG